MGYIKVRNIDNVIVDYSGTTFGTLEGYYEVSGITYNFPITQPYYFYKWNTELLQIETNSNESIEEVALDGGITEQTNILVSSMDESYTTSTSWQEKLSTQFEVKTSSYYIIYCSLEYSNSRKNYGAMVQIQLNDSIVLFEDTYKPLRNGDYVYKSFKTKIKLEVGSNKIDVDFKSENRFTTILRKVVIDIQKIS